MVELAIPVIYYSMEPTAHFPFQPHFAKSSPVPPQSQPYSIRMRPELPCCVRLETHNYQLLQTNRMLLKDNQQLRRELQKYKEKEETNRLMPFTERRISRNEPHSQQLRAQNCLKARRKDSHHCHPTSEMKNNAYFLKCCQNCLEKVKESHCFCQACTLQTNRSWLDGRISHLRCQNDRLRSYCSPD